MSFMRELVLQGAFGYASRADKAGVVAHLQALKSLKSVVQEGKRYKVYMM